MTYLKPYKFKTISGIIFKILGTVTDLTLPIIMVYIVDNCIVTSDFSLIWKLGLLMFAISIMGIATNIGANCFAAEVSQKMGRDLRNDIFRHIQSYSFKELDEIGTPTLINRVINDVSNVQHMVLMMLRVVIRAPILFFGGIVMSCILDFKLTLILCCTAPILVFIVYFGVKKTIPIYNMLQKSLDQATLVLRENLNGLKVIRAMSMTDHERDKYFGKAKKVRDHEESAGKWVAVLNPSMTLVMNIGLVMVIWFGGVRVNIGDMTKGEIMAFVNYFNMILTALLTITRIFMAYTKAVVSQERIEQIFDIDTRIADGEIKSNSEAPIQTKIKFEDVSFSHGVGENKALQNISFEVKKGETLGIIGSTGSGKSSLINLILRFYDVDSGEVTIDGVNVKDYNLKYLRNKIAVVLQQNMLFSETVEENVRWGNKEASDAEILDALETSQSLEFVKNMPEGMKTMLSQGGANLSGGQKQRLSIARALVKNPEILIMDDSSSALDYETDAKLRNIIKNKYKKATVIIIAQRISSVSYADNIIVLEDGQILGKGTHEYLMENCSTYREISNSQDGKSR